MTGASPIVDVQSTSRAQVLNRDLLDAVPAGRSYQGYAQLVPGISLSSPDVGGEASMQNTYMSVDGATSANVTMQVDGQMINGLQSDGSVQSYFNNMMSEEMSFQTAGIGADTSGGGVRVNMIPQTGGNKFAGAFFAAWAPGQWQSDNLTPKLISQGLGDLSLDHQAVGLQLLGGRPPQERQTVVLLLGPSLGELRHGGRHVLLPGLRQVVRTQERPARHRRSGHPQRACPRHLADDVQDETECV